MKKGDDEKEKSLEGEDTSSESFNGNAQNGQRKYLIDRFCTALTRRDLGSSDAADAEKSAGSDEGLDLRNAHTASTQHDHRNEVFHRLRHQHS